MSLNVSCRRRACQIESSKRNLALCPPPLSAVFRETKSPTPGSAAASALGKKQATAFHKKESTTADTTRKKKAPGNPYKIRQTQ